MRRRIVAFLMAIVVGIGLTGCASGQETGREPYSKEEMPSGGGASSGGEISSNGISLEGELPSNGEMPSQRAIPSEAEELSGASAGIRGERPEMYISAAEQYDMADSYSAVKSSVSGMRGAASAESGYGEYPEIDWNTEEYKYMAENPWMSVSVSPFSTFAADVDTASYANVRRMLVQNREVVPDAVRIEEMVNYFRYDYPEPKKGEPFSVTTELAECPWNDEAKLLLVGLAAKDLEIGERVASNLVFLVDVSGSMDTPDKLPLVQRSFRLLCEELGADDRISLVTYANGVQVVLNGVSGEEQTQINEAMEDLFAGGGTNGSEGIQKAYELAEKYFIEGGNNRVILATDGDLNIGITDEGSLTRLIEEKAKNGVFLSVLGFGSGNLSDARMEALADHGNGNYSYIDSVAEARKVLIEEMGGTLFTVAKDVKLQVEFNPAKVKGYRLIGYENRTMAAEEFADDAKDGGEIGAGHQVTALYEIALTDSKQELPAVESRYGKESQADTEFSDEYLTVNIRYKEPAGSTSKLLTYPVSSQQERKDMSENLSWAAGVAQVGMLLKQSEYAGNTELKAVLERLEKLDSAREDDYRKEFLYLFSRYGR